MKNDYNGWKNRETWNIALWFNNDQNQYNFTKKCENFQQFREGMTNLGVTQTEDGISYWSDKLDIKALDEAIQENHV